MKKIVSIVMAISILFSTLTLVGCGDHEHSFGEWAIEKAATCTDKGAKIRTCECGEKETEEIDALGHNFVDGTCTECGAKK